jgi:hypothetical protein
MIKRKEEQLKLVLNWAFKHLKGRFLRTMDNLIDNEDTERLFYEHYFGEVARKRGIELIRFYKPNFKQATDDSERSFNSKFIKNIRLSAKFMRDFIQAVSGEIFKDHVEIIETRLFTFLSKWEAHFHQSRSFEETSKEICQLIQRSKKFKFPWSHREVSAAVELTLHCLKSDKSHWNTSEAPNLI